MFLCDFRLPSFPPGEVPSRGSQNQHTAGRAAVGGQEVRWLFTPRGAVRILFSIPAVRRMVVASRIRLHGVLPRTVLPHAPVLVQASAREARANGSRSRRAATRAPVAPRPERTNKPLWLGRAASVAGMQYMLWQVGDIAVLPGVLAGRRGTVSCAVCVVLFCSVP